MTTLVDGAHTLDLPDWRNETVVIVASGPSAATTPVEMARGKAKFIVINDSYRLAPWSDVLFACDWRWWRVRKGVPGYSGIRLTTDHRMRYRSFYDVWSFACPKVGNDKLTYRPGSIAWGGNSGMGALNIALQLGASKVILVGYDMHLDDGVHWHGPHTESDFSNPEKDGMRRWKRYIDAAAQDIRPGQRVVNVSPRSALQAYPKMTMQEALIC